MTDLEIKEALRIKVDREWADFKAQLQTLSIEEIINCAGEIAHMEECRKELTSGLYPVEDLAFLLSFESPLAIASEAWDSEQSCVSSEEFGHALWRLRDQGHAESDCERDPHYLYTGDSIYTMRPALPEEAGLFYAQTPEQDEELGAIGHVRIDFGHGGKEFWPTWHPRGTEELNSPEFKAELDEVVGQLRESVLCDLSAMRSYCHHHGGEIEGGICTQNYGYTVETERYRYLLRCNPIEGDYQAYLSCFDKQAQKQLVGRVTFANGEQIEYTDPAEYLKTVREELPYQATTGFRFETLTSNPEVRKAVDDMLYDLYSEENPRRLEEYQEQPDIGMTMGGI